MDDNYTTVEKKQCLVCLRLYDTGVELIDSQHKPTEATHTLTGLGLCPEHQQRVNDGYVALVAIDTGKSELQGGTVVAGGEYRLGKIMWVKREMAQLIAPQVPTSQTLVFCHPNLIDALDKLVKETENESK